ncbi:hypothetical protein BIFADO_02343 [Bifidobacterium adolescentis L2-32]|uniref:Uncharacterized protein n=1 Tax=Bifidobacterium adolescentis L2-32 TaxID=411481 RepID=A7A900_BIFAD|nr:hypothetical protein BIFADO_02343 [Bifidobacterium adolescentis L2-32]
MPQRPNSFQSTLSVRRATEGDENEVSAWDFNPRSP